MLEYNEDQIYHMHRYPIKVMLDAVKDYDVRVICFGSTVKGTADWRSDIDIAFMSKNVEDDATVYCALLDAQTDEDYPFFERDIIPMRKMKQGCQLLSELDKGMLLKDFK